MENVYIGDHLKRLQWGIFFITKIFISRNYKEHKESLGVALTSQRVMQMGNSTIPNCINHAKKKNDLRCNGWTAKTTVTCTRSLNGKEISSGVDDKDDSTGKPYGIPHTFIYIMNPNNYC
jgi:hypothetical protein